MLNTKLETSFLFCIAKEEKKKVTSKVGFECVFDTIQEGAKQSRQVQSVETSQSLPAK